MRSPSSGAPRRGPRVSKSWRKAAAALAIAALGLAGLASPAQAAPANLSLGATATATKAEAGSPAFHGIDGDSGTLWKTGGIDPNTEVKYTVDLKGVAALEDFVIEWGWSNANTYDVVTSVDGDTWSEPLTFSIDASGPVDKSGTFAEGTKARYVQIDMKKANQDYGYEFKEFQINGTLDPQDALTNFARGASISATVDANTDEGSELANAIDGDLATQFKTVNNPTVENPDYPVEITLEFTKPATLDSYRVLFGWGYARSYSVATSLDGTNWSDPIEVSEANDQADPLASAGTLASSIPAKYFKVSLDSIRGYDDKYWNYEIKEIEVWGTEYVAPQIVQEPVDLARFGTAVASKTESGNGEERAIDGDPSTRWSTGELSNNTEQNATETYTLDLGTVASLDSSKINWEYSYALDYTLTVADTEEALATAEPVVTVTDSDGDVDENAFPAGTSGRWVKITMTKQRENWWDPTQPHFYGYSFYSFEVWGIPSDPIAVLSSPALADDAGSTIPLSILLNKKLATPTTLKLTTQDGTALAGTDYTAIDKTVTVPANTLRVDIDVKTMAGGNGGTFTIKLAAIGTDIAIGGSDETTVTLIKAPIELAPAGDWTTLYDFENGEQNVYSWGDSGDGKDGNTPAIDVVAGDRTPSSTKVLELTKTNGNSWGGVSNDFASARNWKEYDAFRFWFKGTDSGKTLTYQLKSGEKTNATTFETDFVDDSTDWKAVEIAFKDLRNKNNSADRFDAKKVQGFSFGLGGFSGTVLIDDLELRERAGDIETFDGDVTLTTETEPVGIYGWANPDAAVPDFDIVTDDRAGAATGDNKVLAGTYQVETGGWGGVTENFADAQDWSSYQGIRFWWYASQESNPASPTAGADIKFEIRTGGGSGADAALYQTTFKDNWGSSTSRWKLVEIPFSSLQRRADYQPTNAPTDAKPILSRGWGWSLTFPAGTGATGWKVDSIQAYGAASSADDITVSVDPGIALVDNGDKAKVSIKATSVDGLPLASSVDVAFATADGSAKAGTDYTETSGTVTFAEGAESGSTSTIEVATIAVAGEAEARSFAIDLTPSIGESAGAGKVVINAHGLAYLDSSKSDAERTADLLTHMSLEDKVGQMAQAERLALQSDSISRLRLGSVLSGGGSVPEGNTADAWVDMVNGYQRQALSTSLQIPLIYGVDAVHGHSNVVGATILPHNIGLGSTRNPQLIEAGMRVTAKEVRATGVPWTFAPTLAVTRDERWGRSYESFGEDPSIVKIYAKQAVQGLQGTDPTDLSGSDKVLATAKHWAGDGGTEYGTGTDGYKLDQGITKSSTLEAFLNLHASVYDPAISAGVGSIMPSYSAVQIGDGDPVRMHLNKELNTDVLKVQKGFKGFLISDWEGVDKAAKVTKVTYTEDGEQKTRSMTYDEAAVASVNSGMDMVMAPYNYETFINAIKAGVQSGAIETSRIDDAVSRILEQKFALGLFEEPFATKGNVDEVGSEANRAVAREAAAESQVLLKNDGAALPLSAGQTVYVAGSTADNLGRQMGGWTISWQGGTGQTTDGTTIGQALKAVGGDNVTIASTNAVPDKSYDVGVVVVGEKPYAEGVGDVGNSQGGTSLELSAFDKTAIANVAQKVDKVVVLVVSGRPQIIDESLLGSIDALVASWLPGSEGDGVADVIYGKKPFTGSLSVTWPASADQVPINVGDEDYSPLYPFGWGLHTDSAKDRLASVADAVRPGVKAVIEGLLANDALWDANGNLANAATGLVEIQKLAAMLTGADDVAAASKVASIARDVAAATYTVNDAEKFAGAEVGVISGKPADSVVEMASLAGFDLDPNDSVASADASLSDLTVNGTSVENFAASKLEYTVELPFGSSLPTVAATAATAGASALVTQPTAIPGDATVVVIAADGVTTSTYTVHFTVTPPSNDASLSDLTVNGKSVEGFAASTFGYSVELPAGSSVPVVEAVASNAAAVVTVTDATAVPGSTSVVVRAQDGVTTSTYTVHFTVQKPDTNNPGAEAKSFSEYGPASVSGTVRYGRTVTAKLGTARPSAEKLTYQWFRNGKVIAGATQNTYKVGKKDVGAKLRVAITLHKTGYIDGVVTSKAVKAKKAKTTTKHKVLKASAKKVTVRVTVRASGIKAPSGKVKVKVGSKTKTIKLTKANKGKIRVTIKRPGSGKLTVRSSFKGTKYLASSSAKKAKTVRVG